jgi:hypothetical protein
MQRPRREALRPSRGVCIGVGKEVDASLLLAKLGRITQQSGSADRFTLRSEDRHNIGETSTADQLLQVRGQPSPPVGIFSAGAADIHLPRLICKVVELRDRENAPGPGEVGVDGPHERADIGRRCGIGEPLAPQSLH